MEKHPGIRIDKTSFKGAPGLIAGLAILVAFLVGIPFTRWFLLITVLAGVVLGAILYFLYFWHTSRR